MTVGFTGELTLTELPLNWQRWRLEQDLSFESSYGTVRVPKGFDSDGASVPRPLWWFLPAWGRYSRAAVVHDYLCHALFEDIDVGFFLDRRIADTIFLEAMVICGVNVTVRWLMWASVRLNAWARGTT